MLPGDVDEAVVPCELGRKGPIAPLPISAPREIVTVPRLRPPTTAPWSVVTVPPAPPVAPKDPIVALLAFTDSTPPLWFITSCTPPRPNANQLPTVMCPRPTIAHLRVSQRT